MSINPICFKMIGGLKVQRRIVCAANRFTAPPNKNFPEAEFVIPASRHYSRDMHVVIGEINRLREKAGEDLLKVASDENQGFIDQFGDWWSREDAYIIAKSADQIKFDEDNGSRLYSECLY